MQSTSLSDRLTFNMIDSETADILRKSKSFVLAELPAILDTFYDHISKYDETKKFFKSRDHMMHAKDMQIRHWSCILDGNFDATYQASVNRVGEVHNKLGLEPRWYIGGYNALIVGLHNAIDKKLPVGGFRKSNVTPKVKLQSAIIKAALLDMDLVIAVYIEEGRKDRRAALDRLAAEFDSTIGSVVNTVASSSSELQSAARTLTESAKTAESQSEVVVTASQYANNSVQSVAAATEELTTAIGEITRQATESARITLSAIEEVKSTTQKMAHLSSSAQRIGTVVELINSIAAQTNLLALNATIEAARAGDAGRGFAVVAQEVKSLAEQTAKATAEIGDQVSDIQSSTSESVKAIEAIADVINSLNEISSAISQSVAEQGSATSEISRSVSTASAGTNEVSENIKGIAAASTQTGNAASDVLASASNLSTQADKLRTEVANFLHTVKAA